MGKSRLEAFSDGVIAILITIMVLEMKVPIGERLEALAPVVPVFLSYVLSFIYLGIYWNNHHHMLHTVRRVTGPMLWANLHLLFWLSLVPFTTHWMGANHFAPVPTALYGAVLLMAAVCLLRPAAGDHCLAGSGVAPETRCQGRLAGQVFAANLPRGDSDFVLVASPRAGALRTGGTNLARPGSAHRACNCES